MISNNKRHIYKFPKSYLSELVCDFLYKKNYNKNVCKKIMNKILYDIDTM